MMKTVTLSFFLRWNAFVFLFVILNVLWYEERLTRQSRPRLLMTATDTVLEQEQEPESILETKMNAFELLQRRIVDGELPLRVSVNIMRVNGYGNRVYSWLTSLVLALLSDRAVFLANWRNIGKYIDEPFYAAFNYSRVNKSASRLTTAQLAIGHKYRWRLHKSVDYMTRRDDTLNATKSADVVLNSLADAHFFAMCANPTNYAKLFAYGLVSRQTLELATAALNTSESEELSSDRKLESVLFVGFRVAGRLLNAYWRPTASLSQVIDKYASEYFTPRSFVIGIQFRTEFFQLKTKQDLRDSLAFRAFVDCAINIQMSQRQKKDVKWFVASDNPAVVALLLNDYSDRIVSVKEKHFDGWQQAIADSELLARCDELIVTGGSTFGFVAAIKSQRLPYHLDSQANMTQCRRSTLSRPPSRLAMMPSF